MYQTNEGVIDTRLTPWKKLCRNFSLFGFENIKHFTILLLTLENIIVWVTFPFSVLGVIVRLIFALDLYELYMSLTSNPGILVPLPSVNVEQGREVIPTIHYRTNSEDITVNWCPTCHFYKPPNTHHCRECGCCVVNFDHHCVWLDNCIGQRNMHYFFWLLFDTAVGTFICTFYYVYSAMKRGTDLNISTIIVAHYNGWDTTLIVVILFCLLSVPKTPRYKQFIPTLVIIAGLLLLMLHAFLISRPLGLIFLISFETRIPVAFSLTLYELLYGCVNSIFSIWLGSFLLHYVHLFRLNISQKQYIKGGESAGTRKRVTWMTAFRKVVSIMFTCPGNPIPPASPPYNPFCYLPPGQYIP